MTTQDKEAVEAARYQARCWLDERVRESIERAFLAGVEFQKQREKPVNGELNGDD